MVTAIAPQPVDLDGFDYASLPTIHAPFTGVGPDVALGELRGIVEDAIINQPRGLQTMIGPSEIGNPCDHCLAAKLARWDQPSEIAWLPYVGTAMHAQLEDVLGRYEAARNSVHTGGVRYLTEARVMVGHIGGLEVWGSTDLVDLTAGITIDWKLVGVTTLRSARKGPSATYRVQAHLYAKGWNDAGHRIDHVSICYLPRNSIRGLDDAVWWHEPYDETVALHALERANHLHTQITALATISTAARDGWISALPRVAGCRDCPRYPDGAHIPAPGHRPPGNQLAGLIPPAA